MRGRGNKAAVFTAKADGSGPRRLASGIDPAWSPNGRRIAFACWVPFKGVGGQYELFVMNADGSGQRRLTHNLWRDSAPAWSPDGLKIVFQILLVGGGGPYGVSYDYGVDVVNAGGGDVAPLSPVGESRRLGEARAPRPAWSPDGRMIAFLASRGGNYDLYVMNADGSGETNVTHSPANESWFVWSPKRGR